MAQDSTAASGDKISLQEIVFSCCVCQATLSEVYAGEARTGLGQEAGQPGGAVTRLWIAECSHVFCGRHLAGGGVPFFPDNQDNPRATCPVCSAQKKDETAKELFGLRGFTEGQFDNATLAEWVQCPPVALDQASDALRFQYMSLSRYCIYTTQRIRQAARELTEAKEHCFEEMKQRKHAGAEATMLKARVGELEKNEAKLKQWEERKPEIEHYLAKYDEMARDIRALRMELERHGIPHERRTYAYDAMSSKGPVGNPRPPIRVHPPSVRKPITATEATHAQQQLEDSLRAPKPPPSMPASLKRPLRGPQEHPNEPPARKIRVDDSLAMPPPTIQRTPFAVPLRRGPRYSPTSRPPIINGTVDGAARADRQAMWSHTRNEGISSDRSGRGDTRQSGIPALSEDVSMVDDPRSASSGLFRARAVDDYSHGDAQHGLAIEPDIRRAGDTTERYPPFSRPLPHAAPPPYDMNYSSAFARPYAIPHAIPPPTTPAMRRVAAETPALSSPFFRSISSRSLQHQIPQSSNRNNSIWSNDTSVTRSTPYRGGHATYFDRQDAEQSGREAALRRQHDFDVIPDMPRNSQGLFERPDYRPPPLASVVYEPTEPNTHRTRITLPPEQQSGRGQGSDLSTLARIRGLRGASSYGASRQHVGTSYDRATYSRMGRQSVRR